MIFNKPEILAPAGSPESLDAAIGEGADAVYLGLRDFNARIRAKNFSYNQFECITEKLHRLNKRIYVTLNTVFEEIETDRIYNLLKYLASVKPDGVIVQDIGIVRMINNFFPQLNIHASTQMNISSSEAVNFLSKHNVKRVVLSRELDLEQIKKIKNSVTSEIEIFAHGALCVSVSGLCLFSSYFGGKSANRGRCTQACRRLYSDFVSRKSQYLFSLNDFMLIRQIPKIIESRIDSLKIEGRMKSYQYIASVVRAYRHMVDNYEKDYDAALELSMKILQNDFARKKTEYLFINPDNVDILNLNDSGQTGIFLGKVESLNEENGKKLIILTGCAEVNKGDSIRIQSYDDTKRISLKVHFCEIKDKLTHIEIGDVDVNKGDLVFLTNKHDFDTKYEKILPKSLDCYTRHPGTNKIPQLTKTNLKKNLNMPDGFYVKTNLVKDIFIIQSDKPVNLIVHISRFNITELLSNISKTSFLPKDVIIYLEPYFPEKEADWLKDSIDALIAKGFIKFMINNLGQLNILKDKELLILVGPYLYTFNRCAIDFLNSNQIRYITTPLENNRKNLFYETENLDRGDFFVTLFSYPELFQLIARYDLIHSEKILKDNMTDYLFYLNHNRIKTSLTPEKPFCITDKVNELKKSGFSKFIVDFAFAGLNKNTYKKIMKEAKDSKLIDNTTRFNWKEGFYSDQENNCPKNEY